MSSSGDGREPIGETPAGRSDPLSRGEPLRRRGPGRVQQDTFGQRGRTHDPLFRTRRELLAGDERHDDRGRRRMLLGLRVGDPDDEVVGA